MTGSLDSDLQEILVGSRDIWDELRGARIFITGGTGFIGCWLIESFCHANQALGLGARASILTRNPEAFRRKVPHLADNPSIELIHGDVLAFPGNLGSFSHIIHAATDASAQLLATDPLRMYDTVVLGTRNVLGWASTQPHARVLFTSSGAVYGRQPWDLERIPDDWPGAPDCTSPASAYSEGKRAAENLCAIMASQHGLKVTIARCFAFVGPYLPLDTHFAIGNFIRDAMRGGPITVHGDGTPLRSYLYASDMTVYLWHLLVRGHAGGTINVGSEVAISIGELANLVAKLFGGVECRILGVPDPSQKPQRYVPMTGRAKSLGLDQKISLTEGILRTANWYQLKR